MSREGANSNNRVTVAVQQAVADIQLRSLALTGYSSMFYTTQMGNIMNHCCSNLPNSGRHVHDASQQLKCWHCGVVLHALLPFKDIQQRCFAG
jgi:hypothetical protein